jgi:GcrA cell cycle regulator
MSEWDDAAIERLKQLRAEGRSASEIAELLGVSKNSIIGKLYRLKVKPAPVAQPKPKPKAQRQPRPRKPSADKWFKMEPPPAPSPSRPNVPFTRSILELGPGQCKWPQGDYDFVFCGEPQAAGSVYCSEHTERAYNGPHHHPRPIQNHRAVG